MGAASRGTKPGPKVEVRVAVVKKESTDAEQALQAMLNRISFLKCEEAKLDRDIDNTRKRTQDLLSRKADRAKHEDVVVAVQDVLGTIKADKAAQGRSAFKTKPAAKKLPASASINHDVTSTAKPHSDPPTPATVCLQRATSFQATPHVIPTARSASGSMQTAIQLAPGIAVAMLPGDLSPMASRKASRQASGSQSRSGTPGQSESARTASCSPDLHSHISAGGHAGHEQDLQSVTSVTCTTDSVIACQPGMLVLESGQPALPSTTADSMACPTITPVHNSMLVLAPEIPPSIGDEEEVPEEDLLGALGGTGIVQGSQMQGIHQFTTQAAPKVIQVRCTTVTTPVQAPPTVVVAAGVGWGLGPRGTGPAAPSPCMPQQSPLPHTLRAPSASTTSNRTSGSNVSVSNRAGSVCSSSTLRPASSCGRNNSGIPDNSSGAAAGNRPNNSTSTVTRPATSSGSGAASKQEMLVPNEPDMALKQQIWRVRKVFGLEATPLKDQSATVGECGGGAWT